MIRSISPFDEIAGKSEVPLIGSMNLFSFTETIKEGVVIRWGKALIIDGVNKITVYYQIPTAGKDFISPGLKYKVDSEKGAKPKDKIDFVSLMLALFLGTAALKFCLLLY